MSFFKKLINNFKKSEAAVIVENLLAHQVRAGFCHIDPASAANKFVTLAWNKKPDVFEGEFGQRPHKLTVAASALSYGIFQYKHNSDNRNAIIISLGNILSEISVNGRLYPLNSLDFALLDDALKVYIEITAPIVHLVEKYNKTDGGVNENDKQSSLIPMRPDPDHTSKVNTFVTAIADIIVLNNFMGDYKQIPDDDYFILGYIFGFCDAALQISTFDKNDSKLSLDLIEKIFIHIYGEKGSTLFDTVLLFSAAKENEIDERFDFVPEMQNGIQIGGQECLDSFRENDRKNPIGILEYLLKKEKLL